MTARRLAVPGLPLRVSAQDRVPAAAARGRALRDVWAGEPTRRAVPLPPRAVLRDALRLLQPVHPGQRRRRSRSPPTCDQLRPAGRARSRDALGAARFAPAAIGGGTPTYLTAGRADRAVRHGRAALGRRPAGVPLSVETSPATATADRLAVLRRARRHRVSIGVQSFLDAEAHAAGRPQRPGGGRRARSARSATAGVADAEHRPDLRHRRPDRRPPGPSRCDAALAWRPEELYLYPLYVRPLTGLGRGAAGPVPTGLGRAAARRCTGRAATPAARRRLRAAVDAHVPPRRRARPGAGADYCCQDDGMVGLGCGARSYTAGLHYSFDYAVERRAACAAIIDDYLAGRREDFGVAEVGFALDGDRAAPPVAGQVAAAGRRGCDRGATGARFGTDVGRRLPAAGRLPERGWLTVDAGPAAAHRRGAGALRRDRARGSSPPAVRAARWRGTLPRWT